ncbi:MAG TPA: energy transducer TonB [Steroidobacteraceae bacterium]|nr:energy transducer TonB [Steroidobacteraceae bacterium]
MVRRSLVGAVLAVAGFASTIHAGEVQSALPTSPTELKAIVQKLVQSSWDLESFRGWWLRDVRGKTPYDDLRTYVLIESDLTKLRSLLVEAEQQSAKGDEGALRATMQKANGVLMRELANSSLVFWYWGDTACNAYHRQLIERLWQQLDPDYVASAKSVLQAAEKPLLEQAAALMNSARPNLFTVDLSAGSELNKIQSQLAELYGQERVRAAKRVSVANRERGIAPLGRDRRGACTPAKETSHKPQPQLVQPTPGPEYPSYARRVGLSGSVTLHLWISELGCIDRVEVAQSSGAPELDEAALDWAEQDLTVLPAEVDGKPVASDRLFAVNFDLKD